MSHVRNVRGLLGTKLGMTQLWDENNRVVPVTVIEAASNVVTQVRADDTDGYAAVQLGFGEVKASKVTKPLAGHFEKAGVTPRRHLVEIRTADAANYSLGQELGADVFEAGEKIDVTGTSKGKGFAGVMKRHGFPASAPPTARTATTASQARSVAAPPRAGSSRACGWPAGWVPTPSPPRTSPCTRSTPRRASCSSRARSPARAAPSS